MRLHTLNREVSKNPHNTARGSYIIVIYKKVHDNVITWFQYGSRSSELVCHIKCLQVVHRVEGVPLDQVVVALHYYSHYFALHLPADCS